MTEAVWDEIEAEPPRPEPPTMAERAALGGQARARRFEQFRPVPSSWDVLWDADGDGAHARAEQRAKHSKKLTKAKAKPKKSNRTERMFGPRQTTEAEQAARDRAREEVDSAWHGEA